jgi:hypothetical protein
MVFCFAAVGISLTATSTLVARWQDQEAIALVTGGNEYFYFKANLTNGVPDQAFQLFTITSSRRVISAVVMISPNAANGDPRNPLYGSFWSAPQPTIALGGGHPTLINIPRGVWRIECDGINVGNGWDEVLDIRINKNGDLEQEITVKEDKDTIIYHEIDPPPKVRIWKR